MNKKLQSIKMILVAVGLLMGASAWAGTKTLYSSLSSLTTSNWSGHSDITFTTGTDGTVGNYINIMKTRTISGNRGAYLKFYSTGSDFYDNYESYSVDFDVYCNGGWGNNSGSGTEICLLSDGATFNTSGQYTSNYLFDLYASGAWATSFAINGNSGSTVTMTSGKWYHINVSINKDAKATYTVSEYGSTTALATATFTASSSYKCQGLYILHGRGGYDYRIANFAVTTEVSEDVATAPIFTFKKVDGANRVYTLTNTDGSGKLFYTTSPAESAPTVGDDAYTSSDETSIDVTFGTSGKYYAYVLHTNGTTVSNITEQTVTAGALTLATPVFTVVGIKEAADGFFYPEVSFTSDNTSLEGAPTATFNVESPYTFTEKGEITVTASATGYTSSSATYTVSKKYQQSKMIDFGALTAAAFDVSIWETGTGVSDNRWNTNASNIPTDVTYFKLKDKSLETSGTALSDITISNASTHDPQVYIGYGLLTPYYQGVSGNNMNFKVNDANAMDYVVYDGWNSYGSGTFNTVQTGNDNFALYRHDTMLRTIKVYSGDYSFGIVGDFTGGWDTDVEMTQSTEDKNVYTLVIDKFTATAATKYEYKLRADGQWGGYQLPDEGNNDYYFENAGVYKLTFTANIKANTLTLAVEENDDYTLVGCFNNDETPSFFGTTWDVNNADNLMTKNEDGTYTKTFNNVYLEAGTILYKVVKNHSFDTNWGFNGNNADYGVNVAGIYDITFTFNPNALLSNGFNLTCDVTAIPSTVAKTISAAGYATYCSPYALDFSSTGLTAYIAKKDDSNKVTFTEVTKVPANTGVLLKGDAGDYTINTTTEATDNVTDNVLVGVTKDTKKDAGIFVLMNGTQGVGFYKTTKEFTVGANTAYLPALPTPETGETRTFIGFDFEDNTTTGISSMHNAQCIMHNEVYNLNGQRVMRSAEGRLQGKNAKKGLYIVNGKKVIK